MPRGKKKGGGRKKDAKGAAAGGGSEEEYDLSDNMSTTSALSDGSVAIVGDNENDEVDESSTQELFEDKLKDLIDATTEKSAKTRCGALLNLKKAFSSKYLPEFVSNRKITILDSVERCLKKGKGEEQAAAAHLGVLLLLQLEPVDGEEVYNQLEPIFSVTMNDPSASPKVREVCATALGISTFIAVDDLEKRKSVMNSLEKIFATSFQKGDHSIPSHSPAVCQLHCAAVSSFSLLLTIASTTLVKHYLEKLLYKLPDLLKSNDLDLRIAGGEAIALLYELAREEEDEFYGNDVDDLIDNLKQLSTDSQKHRAKKERRQQRSSFREILATVQDGDWPVENIKFNARESLTVEGWTQKIQYDSFKSILATGTNFHLTENLLLREIFGLGNPISFAQPLSRPSRSERHAFNSHMAKLRTKNRGKNRDKRAARVPSDD